MPENRLPSISCAARATAKPPMPKVVIKGVIDMNIYESH